MHFEKRMTECGAPLYVFEMPYAQSVAAGVLLHAGTAHEIWPKEAGLAHSFEHMVFTGNERFKTSKTLGAYIEEVGGMCEAWTSKEVTFFHTVVPKNYLKRSVLWLYHLLSSPRFLEKHIATEMETVILEVKQRDDELDTFLQNAFVKAVYGSHPLGRDTLGIEESVRSFTRENFLAYHGKFCHAKNFSFVITGNAKTEEALALVNSHAWKEKKDFTQMLCPQYRAEQRKQIKVIESAGMKQVHAYIGTHIVPASPKELTALQLFAMMTSGGSSSPLFQEVRDKRGLCYEIYSTLIRSTNNSIFHVYVDMDTKGCTEAVKVIKEVIQKSMINEALFRKAKKLIEGRIALQYEGSADVLQDAAKGILFYGKPVSSKEMIQEIEEIAFDDMRRVCTQYLNVDTFTEVYLAPPGFKL